jgi:hypothetical protein
MEALPAALGAADEANWAGALHIIARWLDLDGHMSALVWAAGQGLVRVHNHSCGHRCVVGAFPVSL